MINFRKYPYRVGETYGQDGQLTSRQITMAVNKPVRQAKKQQQKQTGKQLDIFGSCA